MTAISGQGAVPIPPLFPTVSIRFHGVGALNFKVSRKLCF